jgi:hypothetical protein
VFNAGISAPGAKRPLLIVRRCHLWANLEEQEARTAARKRLDEALEAIRALCEPVEAPRDTAAHIRFFCVKDTADKAALKENEPKRLTLYKLAASLLRAYADVASEMTEAGYSDAEITAIKSEVDHFAKVRSEVKLASGDSIDLKMYEPAMRHLIDTYIRAVDSELISAFDDMSLVQLIVERGAVAVGALPKVFAKVRRPSPKPSRITFESSPPTANLAVKGITNRLNPESQNARKSRPAPGFLAKSNTCSA